MNPSLNGGVCSFTPIFSFICRLITCRLKPSIISIYIYLIYNNNNNINNDK